MFSSIVFSFYVALPLLGWLLRKKLGIRKGSFFIMFAVTVLTGAFLYIAGAFLVGLELKGIWDPDVNGQLDESTPEMTKAKDSWARDTGRSMVPIIALPATIIWVSLNFAIFASIGAIWGFFVRKKTEIDQTE